MKLKGLIENYEATKARSDAADKAWDEDTVFDEAIEAEWDNAYVAYFSARQELADEIQKLTGVDRDVANRMIATQFEQIKALVA